MASSLQSPYDIVEEGNFSYSFTTKHGVVYHVYFLDYSAYLPSFSSVYMFNIEPEEDTAHPMDSRIAVTVVELLKRFFAHNENAMIMVCDTLDGKELKRKRLFSRWFLQYNNGDIQKFDASSEDEDYLLYVSLFVHKKNPHFKELVSAFYELVKNNLVPSDDSSEQA